MDIKTEIPEVEIDTESPEYQKALRFLFGVKPGVRTAYSWCGPLGSDVGMASSSRGSETANSCRGAMCHGGMSSVPGMDIVIGAFAPTEARKDLALRFWDFLRKDSPWRELKPVLVSVEGLPKGFYFNKAECDRHPFNLLKNFCILCRVFNEKDKSFNFWGKLVDLGVSGTDALYLITILDEGTGGLITPSLAWNYMGSHWPLTEWDNSYDSSISDEAYLKRYKVPKPDRRLYIDWDVFESGRYHRSHNLSRRGAGINGYFCLLGGDPRLHTYRPFSLLMCKKAEMKGRFINTEGYELAGVLEKFKEWKQGVQRNETTA